jgi:hypothetical protein
MFKVKLIGVCDEDLGPGWMVPLRERAKTTGGKVATAHAGYCVLWVVFVLWLGVGYCIVPIL